MIWVLNAACPSRCSYCAVETQRAAPLARERVAAAARDILANGFAEVIFVGGEPLLARPARGPRGARRALRGGRVHRQVAGDPKRHVDVLARRHAPGSLARRRRRRRQRQAPRTRGRHPRARRAGHRGPGRAAGDAPVGQLGGDADERRACAHRGARRAWGPDSWSLTLAGDNFDGRAPDGHFLERAQEAHYPGASRGSRPSSRPRGASRGAPVPPLPRRGAPRASGTSTPPATAPPLDAEFDRYARGDYNAPSSRATAARWSAPTFHRRRRRGVPVQPGASAPTPPRRRIVRHRASPRCSTAPGSATSARASPRIWRGAATRLQRPAPCPARVLRGAHARGERRPAARLDCVRNDPRAPATRSTTTCRRPLLRPSFARLLGTPGAAQRRAHRRAVLYLHVPFCACARTACWPRGARPAGPHRRLRRGSAPRVVSPLRRARDLEVSAVHVGGGTPRCSRPTVARRAPRRRVSRRRAPGFHVGVEAHLAPAPARGWTRSPATASTAFSLGVETFTPEVLRRVNWSDQSERKGDVRDAVANAWAAGVRAVNLDPPAACRRDASRASPPGAAPPRARARRAQRQPLLLPSSRPRAFGYAPSADDKRALRTDVPRPTPSSTLSARPRALRAARRRAYGAQYVWDATGRAPAYAQEDMLGPARCSRSAGGMGHLHGGAFTTAVAPCGSRRRVSPKVAPFIAFRLVAAALEPAFYAADRPAAAPRRARFRRVFGRTLAHAFGPKVRIPRAGSRAL